MTTDLKKIALFSLIPSTVIAAAVALLNPGRQPVIGFAAAFLLGWLSSFLLTLTCARTGCPRLIVRLTAISFAIRFLIGVILFAALPVYGHNEAPPQAGYLYLDAYQRDMDAWKLAESGGSLALAFSDEFHTDQYGGLLSLSGAVYRFLSPDAHRPLLILILTAFFTSLGLPFFWKAVSQRWGKKTALASAWLYALYPESIILGASQMREPILIGLSAVAFWGLLAWKTNKRKALAALIPSLLALVFISVKAGASLTLALGIWFWLENLLPHIRPSWRLVSSALLLAAVLGGVYLYWDWLVDSARWDLYLTEIASGRVQFELEFIGGRYRTPFIVGYGLTQPVLPAAIVYPSIPLARAVAIFRAVGWYALVPMMASGFILVWTKKRKGDRRVLLLFFLTVIAWTLLSSARAGGDQWDNPRYRSIFLVWMVLLAGWAWMETIARRSPWLWRLVLLELIYIGYFLHWYISRYQGLMVHMRFWRMVTLLGRYALVIILGGLIFDLVYNKVRKSRQSSGKIE
jgi:hypothetical protein